MLELNGLLGCVLLGCVLLFSAIEPQILTASGGLFDVATASVEAKFVKAR